MNTTELAAAYQRLLAAAQAITPDSALDPGQRADADWTLCHVALSDQLLTETARQVLASRTAPAPALVVDNRPAMDPAAIAGMTASTVHRGRIDAVRLHAAGLIAQLGQIPDDAARASLTLRLHDRTGQHVSDTEMTWADLIRLRTRQHIPAHADRLRGYLLTAPDSLLPAMRTIVIGGGHSAQVACQVLPRPAPPTGHAPA